MPDSIRIPLRAPVQSRFIRLLPTSFQIRACRRVVQSGTRRSHLYPNFQPDDGGARRAASGAGRRRRRDLHGERHGGAASGDREPLLNAGDHIVASSSLYGGSINLLTHTLPRFGITTTFVKPRALDQFRAAIQPNTRLVIGETIGNPGLEVLDIPAVARIAHDAKIPLLIDNTFATPYLSRPIELGADVVMNSATKWIGGHGIAIGGVIVDGGRFDWRASGKFPVLTEPYAGYHGIVFDEQFGPAAFIMRARTEGLRDFGACLSPTNAFQLLQGVETLGIRMERHVANTHAVLEFLTANKAVEWVLHPSLESHPDHELAKRLLPRGAGSIVSFGIKGGRPAGKKFIESLRMISHLANVGDAKTLVIHPASTTHQQMDAAQLKAAGVGEELVRLSVGIESASDIIDDLGQALRISQKA